MKASYHYLRIWISPVKLEVRILIGATWISLTPEAAEELYRLLHTVLFKGVKPKTK